MEIPKKLSIIVPVYDETECLHELIKRTGAALSSTGLSWELVLVNDGSGLDCSSLLSKFASDDPRVKIVVLSRNFGHQAAITAGLNYVKSDATIVMDADLEDPPELIPQFVKEWESGADVVIGRRTSRQDRGVRGFLFKLFHALIKHIADSDVGAESGVFGLMTDRAVRVMLTFGETNRFFPGLRSYLGFTTKIICYDRQTRYSGKPKQSISRLLKYAMDAVFGFSYKPLRLTLILGLIVFFPACGYAALLFVQRLLNIDVVKGFTTTAVAVLVLGSVQLISVGIIGEYIGRIYDEVKRRPMYIVKDLINFTTDNTEGH